MPDSLTPSEEFTVRYELTSTPFMNHKSDDLVGRLIEYSVKVSGIDYIGHANISLVNGCLAFAFIASHLPSNITVFLDSEMIKQVRENVEGGLMIDL